MTRRQLIEQIYSKGTYLCIGLDTDPDKIPASIRSESDAVVRFNKAIIDATSDLCVGYKINTAFYEAMGSRGWKAMEETVAHIPDTHFRIADAKRGDIGNTSYRYAKAFLEEMPFVLRDAVAFLMGPDETLQGSVAEVARRLGIGRSTLYRKLREMGLDDDQAGAA